MRYDVYTCPNQMRISHIVANTKPASGQKFYIEVFFHDENRMVCRVRIEPTLRDHRTGRWITCNSLSLCDGIAFEFNLRDQIRLGAVKLVEEIIDSLFGED